MLKNQEKYNVWMMRDPNVQIAYTGSDGTEGAISAWNSDNNMLGLVIRKNDLEKTTIKKIIFYINTLIEFVNQPLPWWITGPLIGLIVAYNWLADYHQMGINPKLMRDLNTYGIADYSKTIPTVVVNWNSLVTLKGIISRRSSRYSQNSLKQFSTICELDLGKLLEKVD